jgi:aspartyl-tRNA(Asn)/glutamyl-tRNA(Gln) amidotransferase subunit B
VRELPTMTVRTAPFAFGGSLMTVLPSGEQREVAIAHIQLEQDSGKTLQSNAVNQVLVDLNRAGSGLMEIVSRPDMRCLYDVLGGVLNARLDRVKKLVRMHVRCKDCCVRLVHALLTWTRW